jgi:hypothetical protein
MRWLPELLLRPSEIANLNSLNLSDKINKYIEKISQQSDSINGLTANVLLHSVLRSKYRSQPVPVHLYFEGYDKKYDNIHIVVDEHDKDTLIMGFAYLIPAGCIVKYEIESAMKEFADMISSEVFDTKRGKILDVKEDNYIIPHDIDEILDANTSLDEHLDRFRFSFFFGYESPSLHESKESMNQKYEEDLIEEIRGYFSHSIKELINYESFSEELHIDVHIYPLPTLELLIDAVKGRLGTSYV